MSSAYERVWGESLKRDFCRVNDGRGVMEGGRDLINQVNPFLRSLVVSVEMQFEKGFRPPVLNKVCSETTVDVPQVFLLMLGFHSCRLFNIHCFFLFI